MADEIEDLEAIEETVARTLRRRVVDLPARVDGVDAEYTATDISIGGAFLAGSPQLAEGSTVRVEIALPEEPLRCAATVRWARAERLSAAIPEGMGVAFVDLAPDDQDRIATLVEA